MRGFMLGAPQSFPFSYFIFGFALALFGKKFGKFLEVQLIDKAQPKNKKGLAGGM